MDALVNRDNYLMVRKYLAALREDGQLAEASIARYKFYLRHALLWAMETPFSQAHNIKPGLLIYLDDARNDKGEPLAAETRKKIVENARKFFEWCKMEAATKFRSLPVNWVQKLKFQRKNAPDVQKEPEFLLLDEVIQLASLSGDETDLAHWRGPRNGRPALPDR
jgi:site-specific recombinase XerD